MNNLCSVLCVPHTCSHFYIALKFAMNAGSISTSLSIYNFQDSHTHTPLTLTHIWKTRAQIMCSVYDKTIHYVWHSPNGDKYCYHLLDSKELQNKLAMNSGVNCRVLSTNERCFVKDKSVK